MSTELQWFVKKGLSKGISKTKLKDALKQANWPVEDIDAALSDYADIDFPIAVPKRKPYLSAREAFMYLVMFLTLYISAFALGTILFEYINRWMPDVTEYSYIYDSSIAAIRSATAALIITFPVFYWMARLLRMAMAKDPEKRGSKVRKWLTYVTLFVTASIIIGDLIALLTYFLNGDITTRFLLKVAVILGIAGCIFGYYLWDLRGEEKETSRKMKNPPALKAFIAIIVTIMTVTALSGLWVSGSPAKERARRLDDRRLSDLQSITNAIDNWYSLNKKLPSSLDELASSRDSYVSSIMDPATNTPYEYRITDATSYQLCSTFDTDSNADGQAAMPVANPGSKFWEHPAGRKRYAVVVHSDKTVPQIR